MTRRQVPDTDGRRRHGLPYGFAEVAVASLLVAAAYCGAWTCSIEPALHAPAAQDATQAAAQDARGSASARQAETPQGQGQGAPAPKGKLAIDGDASLSAAPSVASLRQAIFDFEARGYVVGICARDLRTGVTITYDADADFYTASAIKGPYVISVFQELVDAGSLDAADAYHYAQPIILNSDNDAYVALSDRLGRSCFAAWLRQGHVEAGAYPSVDAYAAPHYPHSTARQLAQEWAHAYAYLASGRGHSATLLALLANRTVSPIKDALGEKCQTLSKAGWYPVDEGIADPATNDAGIVMGPRGLYVVAILSNAPEDFDAVEGIAAAVDQALPRAVDAVACYPRKRTSGSSRTPNCLSTSS